MTEVVFAVGAGEGSTQCLDIAIADDDQTEGLECFSFGVGTGIFVPICIEDNDSKAFHCLDNHALIEGITIFFSVAFVSFAETNLVVSEPGIVEVVIVLIGNVTFEVTVIVEFRSENSTATGIIL